jgi:hypothetical protein
MAALTKMQDRFVSADGNIADELFAIVMDLTGAAAALRTAVEPLLHPQPDMHLFSLTFGICYDYIF